MHLVIYNFLRYHHIIDHINHLIESLYSGFHSSIITFDFQTSYIPIGNDVLQGDCFIPLHFNLCFNTFILQVKSPAYHQFGFLLDCFPSLTQVHCFKFAYAQLLVVVKRMKLNTCSIATPFGASQAQMVFRGDKCVTFRLNNLKTRSGQMLTQTCNIIVTLVDTLTLICQIWSISKNFLKFVGDIISKIIPLHLYSKNEFQLYNRCLLPKLSRHLTLADLTKHGYPETLITLPINIFVHC